MGPMPTQRKHRAVVAVAHADDHSGISATWALFGIREAINANGIGRSIPGVRRASRKEYLGRRLRTNMVNARTR